MFFITIFPLVIIWNLSPKKDNLEYFKFADSRGFFSIPNFCDVVSNIPFLLVGILGVFYFIERKFLNKWSSPHLVLGLMLSCTAILVFFGSTYFHLEPTLEKLFWDRMPMTIGFSSILSLVILDRVNYKLGKILSPLLIFLGLITVIGLKYEILDLRPYALLQYGSIIAIFLIIFLKNEGLISTKDLVTGLFLYLVAKTLEHFDTSILNVTGIVSGHTLKHLFAAAAIYYLIRFMKNIKSEKLIIV